MTGFMVGFISGFITTVPFTIYFLWIILLGQFEVDPFETAFFIGYWSVIFGIMALILRRALR